MKIRIKGQPISTTEVPWQLVGLVELWIEKSRVHRHAVKMFKDGLLTKEEFFKMRMVWKAYQDSVTNTGVIPKEYAEWEIVDE
jgi:hypothetical protein